MFIRSREAYDANDGVTGDGTTGGRSGHDSSGIDPIARDAAFEREAV